MNQERTISSSEEGSNKRKKRTRESDSLDIEFLKCQGMLKA